MEIIREGLYRVPVVQQHTGDGRTTIYQKISDGRYVAVKDGRVTKITGASILDDMAALPRASIALGQGREGSVGKKKRNTAA